MDVRTHNIPAPRLVPEYQPASPVDVPVQDLAVALLGCGCVSLVPRDMPAASRVACVKCRAPMIVMSCTALIP